MMLHACKYTPQKKNQHVKTKYYDHLYIYTVPRKIKNTKYVVVIFFNFSILQYQSTSIQYYLFCTYTVFYKFNTIWHQILFYSYFKTTIKQHALPKQEQLLQHCRQFHFTYFVKNVLLLLVNHHVDHLTCSEPVLRCCYCHADSRSLIFATLDFSCTCFDNFLIRWPINANDQSLSATAYKSIIMFFLHTNFDQTLSSLDSTMYL